MRIGRLGAFISVLLVSAVLPAVASAICLEEYDWQCADRAGNTCVGYFAGVHGAGPVEAFQESVPDAQCGNQQTGHSLTWVLRYSGLTAGEHYLRMSYGSQNVCGSATDTEALAIYKKVATNCDDTSTGWTLVMTIGTAGHALADYDLGESGATDICIKLVSQEVSPYRDEFLIDDGQGDAQEGHNHPMIVTKDFYASAEVTNPGSKSGTYVNTQVSDNSREILTEGGSSHNLMHVYTIDNIPAGNLTLTVEGSRPSNSDGDDFKIVYKTTAGSCTTSGVFQQSGITINSSAEQTYTATINGFLGGRLCVGIDDSTGGSNNDTVSIDYVAVANSSCP